MTEIILDHVSQVSQGHIYSGKLRLRSSDFMFKQEKTGKIDHFPRDEVISAEWIARAIGSCLRLKLKNGELHRYDGFGDSDLERVNSFFKKHYDIEIVKKDLCYKGLNHGEVEFNGNTLEFKVKDAMAFEIPMDAVYNASLQNDEIIIEFNPDDDADICMSEIRLYTPAEEGNDSRADLIYKKIKRLAGILDVTGDSLIQFTELNCLQPRGRYDFKFYSAFIHLHGKSYDFKVPKASIMRVMLLPHIDERSHFVVLNVQPPLKLGQTNYHYVIVLFNNDNFVDIDMNCTDQFLQESFNGKLNKRLNGPTYEIITSLFHILYGVKITYTGSFRSKADSKAVQCNYKTTRGLLYPLERGFMYVPKPAIFIRFEEVVNVQFSRGSAILKSFDFEIETRNDLTHTFQALDKGEYERMYDFVRKHNLNVKNINSGETKKSLMENWSDEEEEDQTHEAYVQKMKAEAKANADDSNDDSEDDDFRPPEESASEKEDYDSNASFSDSDSSDSADSDASAESQPKKKQKSSHSEKKSTNLKSTKKKTAPKQQKKAKKEKKDPNIPTRPQTAYMLWLSTNRAKIIEKIGGNPSVPDIARKGGELWGKLSTEEKKEYQDKAIVLRKEYEIKMKEYKEKVASGSLLSSTKNPAIKHSNSKKLSSSGGATSDYKSTEFVKSEQSSSSDDDVGSD